MLNFWKTDDLIVISFNIDERNAGIGANDEVIAFAYQHSGCYVAVWPVEDRGSYKIMDLLFMFVNMGKMMYFA